MLERPSGGERAILVSITIIQGEESASLAEFIELAHSAGVITVATITGKRQTPDSSHFVGTGKLKEIEMSVLAQQADVVLFNHTLTPAQERNLERALSCQVLDRTGVILDIFAQRARSFEGKLQVELAQLKHLSTRLVRGWTHLERQKGGIGLRGPGETQLETDRRLIGERIKAINKRLEKVTQQRELSRKARQRAQLPVVSLVGYTNAGKSTLFNRMTNAQVFAADQLFATLDATLRRVTLPNKTPFILADTVGFIQQLPHDLVAAFRATLEETRQADLLLHIVDASNPQRQQQVIQVNQVLQEIGASQVPQIIIYNKIDQLDNESARCERNWEGQVTKIWLSAQKAYGLEWLEKALAEQLNQSWERCWIRIPIQAGRLRARIFAQTQVLQEQYEENGNCLLEIQQSAQYFQQLAIEEIQVEFIH